MEEESAHAGHVCAKALVPATHGTQYRAFLSQCLFYLDAVFIALNQHQPRGCVGNTTTYSTRKRAHPSSDVCSLARSPSFASMVELLTQ